MKIRLHRAVRDKVWQKHEVRLYEVLEAIRDPHMKLTLELAEPEGRVYKIVGKTESGRLLRVIYIRARGSNWLKTALDAYDRDKKAYNRK